MARRICFREEWLVELNLLPNRSSAQRVTMQQGRKRATNEQHYLWHTGSSSDACSGSYYQIIMLFGQNTPWLSSKVVLEAHDISRHGSGDLLKNRFWPHDENAGGPPPRAPPGGFRGPPSGIVHHRIIIMYMDAFMICFVFQIWMIHVFMV